MDVNLGFKLKKLVEILFLTPVLPLLVIAYGLLLAHRKRRKGFFYAWLGLLVLVFLSTPATVTWMAEGLESYPSLQMSQLKSAQAIVILGGGERDVAREYGGPVPNSFTLQSLQYGARLVRESGLPVLVSGGAPIGSEPEAKLMAESLKTDFGITVRWVESRSLDTADNAFFSAEILKNAGIKRIVLVTTALHMRRSALAFGHEGLEVVPAPTVYVSDVSKKKHLAYYLPGTKGAENGWSLVHEWVGILVLRIKYAFFH